MKPASAILLAGLTVALTAAPALAADLDAKTVRTACIKAATGMFKKAGATVDLKGTTAFALALVRGKAAASDETLSIICLYDRASNKAEVGGALSKK